MFGSASAFLRATRYPEYDPMRCSVFLVCSVCFATFADRVLVPGSSLGGSLPELLNIVGIAGIVAIVAGVPIEQSVEMLTALIQAPRFFRWMRRARAR